MQRKQSKFDRKNRVFTHSDKIFEVIQERFEKFTCAKHQLEELEKILNEKVQTKTEAETKTETKTKR